MDAVIYQQDGATPHCSDAPLKYAHHYFPGDRLIFCHTNYPWPAHSPDLRNLWIMLCEALVPKQQCLC